MVVETPPAAAPAPARYRDLFREGRAPLTLAVTLLLLVATLDQLIVATALPTIIAQLGGLALYSWAFAAYTLASIAALPIFGALSGRWGLRPTMAAALGVFVAGSALCAMAPSMAVLVGGRAVQGIGAGGLFALPFIIIGQRFPASLHPRALALTSGVWGISSLSGPLVGALLLELWGWPAIFWVNLPLAGLVLLLAWGSLRDAPAGDLSAAPVNLGSPLLLALATGLILAAPTASPRYAWLLATAGLAAAAGFVIAERKGRARIVPAEAWAARGPLGAALAAIALATVTFFVAQTFLPLLLQSGRGYGAVAVGVLISAGAVAWTLGAMWAGRQAAPSPAREAAIGLVCLVAGSLGLLATVALGLPGAAIYVAWVLAGLGMGVTIQTCNVVVLANARGPQASSITAAGQLALNLGTVAGAALAGFVAQLGFGPSFAPDQAVTALAPGQIALLERGVAFTLGLAVALGLGTLAVAARIPGTAEDVPAKPRQIV